MKQPTLFWLFLASLLAGCSLGATEGPPPEAVAPGRTVVSRPTATPTEPAPSAQPVDAPVIAYNEIKEGQLAEPDQAAEWVFQAKSGERVNVVLNSQFDGYLELRNPEGALVTSNDDRGGSLNAALFDVAIKQPGPHTIVVRSYGRSTGSYALALTGGHPTVGGGQLASGESRQVMLSERGLKWQYAAQKGQFLTVTARAEAGVDSFLNLYGPDGSLLSRDDDSGQNLDAEIVEFEIPADGTYTIKAHTMAQTGLVTVSLTSEAQPSGGGPLVIGRPQSGTLKPGRSHRWQFSADAGQIINLSMTSPQFDTFLELRDARGAILAENDDTANSTNAQIELFTLPAKGTYTVIARSATDTEGGDYELIAKLVKVPPGGGPLSPGQPTQALLKPGQIDTWRFEAEAGSFVSVDLHSNLLDTYLELYSPDQTLLIADDDSGGSLNAALLDFALPESGVYQLVVKSAREEREEGGVYEISLSLTEDLAMTGQLESDQPVQRSLAAGEQHTWIFTATEGDFVTAWMESETLDTHLALYSSDGTLLSLNDDFLGKQAVIANFIAPREGAYRLVGRAYSAEQAGDYTLTLEITDEAQPISPQEANPPDEE